MILGMYIWYPGDELSIDFLFLFMFSYNTKVLHISLVSNYSYSEIQFHTNYFVFSNPIDVVSNWEGYKT